MRFPSFYDDVRPIVLRDPLAAFLGAADGGLIEYRYADVVKLAGHSCPTVAGIYLMTLKGLAALHGAEIPERGGLRVRFAEAIDDGVTGVMANVVGMITGAAESGGFKGIGGNFDRRNLLSFGDQVPAALRLERIESGAAVDVNFRAEVVPPDPAMRPALHSALAGDDSTPFATLWQERVRRILIENIDNPAMIVVTPA